MPKVLKKPPKWLFPRGTLAMYDLGMQALVNAYKSDINLIVIPKIPNWNIEANGQRKDAWSDDINTVINELFLTFGRYSDDFIARDLRNIAILTNTFNRAQWAKITQTVFGVSVNNIAAWERDVVKSWITKNTALIKDMETTLVNDISRILNDGITEGKSNRTITKQLIQETKLKGLGAEAGTTSAIRKARKRAKTIVIDQIGKFNAQLTERRQTDLGITEYIWRNTRSIKVRGNPNGLYPNAKYSHWSREGKMYSWNEPPADGHPGFPIKCQCYAEPVFREEPVNAL